MITSSVTGAKRHALTIGLLRGNEEFSLARVTEETFLTLDLSVVGAPSVFCLFEGYVCFWPVPLAGDVFEPRLRAVKDTE